MWLGIKKIGEETLLDENHGGKEKRWTELLPVRSTRMGKIGKKWERSVYIEIIKAEEEEEEHKDFTEFEIYYYNLKYILNGWVHWNLFSCSRIGYIGKTGLEGRICLRYHYFLCEAICFERDILL